MLALTLGACKQAPSSVDKPVSPYPTANVGVTITNTVNPFFKSAFDTYQAEASANSALTLTLENANNDQAVQYAQYDAMIAKGAKALVINLANPAEGEAVVQKYCGKVGLVFFNRNPGDKALASCEKAYFVDGDAIQGGVLQGLKVLELWKNNPTWDKNGDGKIQFATIKGIPGHAGGKARSKWAIGTMENYPSLGVPVEELFTEFASFDKEKSRILVTGWISDPNFANVEVILANNDTMAVGASEALKAAGLRVPIFGIDATPEAINAIKAGDMTATVLNDAVEQAKVSLRLAANLASDAPPLDGIAHKLEYKTIKIPYQEVK